MDEDVGGAVVEPAVLLAAAAREVVEARDAQRRVQVLRARASAVKLLQVLLLCAQVQRAG